jgi:alanyl aminopeptidase
VQHSFGARARALGFTERAGEDEEQRLLRPSLLSVVGVVGEDRSLQAQAVKVVRAWLKDRGAISPQVVDSALTLAAWNGEPRLFDELVAAVRKEPEFITRRQLFRAIGSFRDPKLAERARGLLAEPALDVRESSMVFWSQTGAVETRAAATTWVKTHYDELTRRLPTDWEAELVWTGTAACSSEGLADLQAFFEPRTTRASGGPRTYANAVETTKQCIVRRARQVPEAVKFLAQWR